MKLYCIKIICKLNLYAIRVQVALHSNQTSNMAGGRNAVIGYSSDQQGHI